MNEQGERIFPQKTDPITRILSEEAIKRHREYARNLRLKYSILQKSETIFNSLNIRDIPWQKLKPDLAGEAFSLLSELSLHECFFASFSEKELLPLPPSVREYESAAELLNHLYRLAYTDNDGGFLVVYKSRGKTVVGRIFPPYRELLTFTPLLAIDLYEHTYFSDYGFERGGYLVAALSHLNLDLLA
ncbi:MAG: hypothetical protein IJF05_00215 [Clostridia bacterium]|nr:hypothetical protein [Clostridia bacterium]